MMVTTSSRAMFMFSGAIMMLEGMEEESIGERNVVVSGI